MWCWESRKEQREQPILGTVRCEPQAAGRTREKEPARTASQRASCERAKQVSWRRNSGRVRMSGATRRATDDRKEGLSDGSVFL